jgi:hypothetical protein
VVAVGAAPDDPEPEVHLRRRFELDRRHAGARLQPRAFT